MFLYSSRMTFSRWVPLKHQSSFSTAECDVSHCFGAECIVNYGPSHQTKGGQSFALAEIKSTKCLPFEWHPDGPFHCVALQKGVKSPKREPLPLLLEWIVPPPKKWESLWYLGHILSVCPAELDPRWDVINDLAFVSSRG